MKTLAIIVNTEPHTVRVVESAPLSHVVARALHETQNDSSREWQLRNADGVLLPLSFAVLDVDATRPFYLNLPPGHGG